MQQGVLPLRLPDFASFENYLPATNQETITHLHEFLTLQEAKRTAYLWGESGTGKTHLLYAACKTVSNSIYISLQDRNIQTDILVSVEDQSLICLDDLQCAALNLDWERRLMTLVEEVELDGRRLIVAARLPPDGLNLKLPDLVSRLAGKQIFRLNPIGDEERIEIFIDRGRRRGMEIDEQVARYAINRYNRNMHSVLELLNRIELASLEKHRMITIPLLKQIECETS